MKKMKNLKKLMALLLALVMVMGMTTTVMAADGKPAESEKADLTITGITGSATVTLYQIAEGEYGEHGVATDFIGYNYATCADSELSNLKTLIEGSGKPTSGTINAIANNLLLAEGATNKIKPLSTPITKNVTDGAFTQEVTGAGAWIAIITEASDGKVYNPIFLATSYDKDGKLVGGEVGTNEKYLHGETAVAKSSEPTIKKEITGGTVEDDNKDTASVGDKIDYEVKVTVPNYPLNAKDKTLFLTDTMSKGLRFEYDSLAIKLTNSDGTEGPAVSKSLDETSQIYTYTITDGVGGTKTIAQATKQDYASGESGFYINFTYDNLYSNPVTGAVYTPVVTYSAILDDDAVVGAEGNKNKPTLIYSNKPNQGGTWDEPGRKPDTGKEVEGNEEIVYTYQIAFEKTDEAGNPLKGAVFGVYTNAECKEEHLIDIIETNEKGIAVSTKVGKGTYWVKEIKTPGNGYQLNDNAYKIEASWATATKTMTGIERTYTSDIDNALEPVQVGWLKDGKFYAMSEFQQEDPKNNVLKAYLASETKNVSEETSVNTEGSGTAVLGEKIKNTKMPSLPSTGGIGTTIFTIAGCVIMIAAVGLFFASRKKK